MEKKMGRPTTNPKHTPIHVRLDAECEEILSEYCFKRGITKAEGVRRGIQKLKDEI